MIKVEVKRNGAESNTSLLRRFSKRVKSSRILQKVRDNKYASRQESELKKKRSALKRMAKREEIERLKKLGKIKDAFYKKSY